MHNRNGCNEDQLGIIISRAKQSNNFSSCKGELWVRGKWKKEHRKENTSQPLPACNGYQVKSNKSK